MAELNINSAQDLVDDQKKVTRFWYLFFQQVATILNGLIINLVTQVTGILGVSNGGTGASTLTAHAVLLGEGTSPIAFASPGVAGTVLTSNGAGSDPTFQAATGGVTTTGSPASGNLTKFSGATTITNGDLSGDVTTSGTLVVTAKAALKTRAPSFGFSGSRLAAGQYVDTYIPYACTITAATILGDAAGSVVFDVLTNASFSSAPASSIVASAPPTLTTALGSQDTTLTGWTAAIAANTRVRCSVTSTSGLTWATLVLTVSV